MLREASYEDKQLLVLMLPNICAEMIPTGVRVRCWRLTWLGELLGRSSEGKS